MTTVRFKHTLGDLVSDLNRNALDAKPRLASIAAANVIQGNKIAQGFAREASGIHGKNAWKRLSSEMLTPLSGEFGWTGDPNVIVGAGWRHGVNTDLPRAVDVILPKTAADVRGLLDDLFWSR